MNINSQETQEKADSIRENLFNIDIGALSGKELRKLYEKIMPFISPLKKSLQPKYKISLK
jgi:hypothetical protein